MDECVFTIPSCPSRDKAQTPKFNEDVGCSALHRKQTGAVSANSWKGNQLTSLLLSSSGPTSLQGTNTTLTPRAKPILLIMARIIYLHFCKFNLIIMISRLVLHQILPRIRRSQVQARTPVMNKETEMLEMSLQGCLAQIYTLGYFMNGILKVSLVLTPKAFFPNLAPGKQGRKGR